MSLRSILPAAVAVVETTDVDRAVALHPDEAEFVANAVEARRNEFALGRASARSALSMIGVTTGPILVGNQREPVWPSGAVGSITHCDGYVAAAVAHSTDARSIGIDAEPKLPLPDNVIEQIMSADERASAAQLGAFGDRLLFSAKESIYKAWFPLTERWLGFHDCQLTLSAADRSAGSFVGEISSAALAGDLDISQFHGRYVVSSDHVFTAVFLPVLDLAPD